MCHHYRFFLSDIILTLEDIKGCGAYKGVIVLRFFNKFGGWGNQEEVQCGWEELNGICSMTTPGEFDIVSSVWFSITNLANEVDGGGWGVHGGQLLVAYFHKF